MKPRLPALEALERLQQGNRRFVAGLGGAAGNPGPPRDYDPREPQRPVAIVLGCSDSRVPAELVFDQGFGDLFVIRVAGNIVAPSLIASVEFAASQFGTRLVVVLGHTQCGAVLATIDEIRRETLSDTHIMRSIVDRVRPAVEGLMSDHPGADPQELVDRAVRANVLASVQQLRDGSDAIRDFLANSGLMITGAEYSLETGAVEFFEN